MALFRTSKDRKAREAGIDESRIPPGQYYTDKWPVLQAGSVPRVDLATWDFRVFGLVKQPFRLSFDELIELGSQQQTSDIHCVTRWTKLDMPWKGVPMKTVLDQVQPLESARFVIAHAEQGYTANLPIEVIQADDVMLAYEAEGERLARARLPAAAAGAQPLLLEERQVAARAGVLGHRQARLLGGLRLPQRGRPVAGGAIRFLTSTVRNRTVPGPGLPPPSRMRRVPQGSGVKAHQGGAQTSGHGAVFDPRSARLKE